MNIRLSEKEIIGVLDEYIKAKFSLNKRDSFITFDNDAELTGLHFMFVTKESTERSDANENE